MQIVDPKQGERLSMWVEPMRLAPSFMKTNAAWFAVSFVAANVTAQLLLIPIFSWEPSLAQTTAPAPDARITIVASAVYQGSVGGIGSFSIPAVLPGDSDSGGRSIRWHALTRPNFLHWKKKLKDSAEGKRLMKDEPAQKSARSDEDG
jgi:hypothetical protein